MDIRVFDIDDSLIKPSLNEKACVFYCPLSESPDDRWKDVFQAIFSGARDPLCSPISFDGKYAKFKCPPEDAQHHRQHIEWCAVRANAQIKEQSERFKKEQREQHHYLQQRKDDVSQIIKGTKK